VVKIESPDEKKEKPRKSLVVFGKKRQKTIKSDQKIKKEFLIEPIAEEEDALKEETD
jgi:hypothetical protein